jgi:ABC-2 type transport system permease protein
MTSKNRQLARPRPLDSARIIWALFAKDALEALKNKNTIAVIISSLFMVFFYTVFPALAERDEPLALLVYDGGNSSLLPLLEDSRNLRVYSYPSEEQMKQILANGEVPELGLVIPADFDQVIQAGETPRLQGHVLRWVSDTDAEALRSIAETEISAVAARNVPVELASGRVDLLPESRGLGESASFGLAYALIMIGVILVPHLMLEEKQNRTLEVLSLSPASAGHIVAGKALAGIFYCSLGGIIALAVNHTLVVHWWLAILTALIGSLFTVSLGLWLGIKIDSRAQLSMWSWVILLPLIMPIIFSLLEGLIPAVWVRIFSLVPSSVILQLSKTSFANPIPIGLTLLRLAWVVVASGAVLAGVAWLLRLRDREGGALSSPWQPSPGSWRSEDRQSPIAPLPERLTQRSTAEPSAGGPISRVEGSAFDEPRPRGNLSMIGVIAAKDLLEALKNRLILSILLGSTFILLSGALLPLLIVSRNIPRIVVYDLGRSAILRDLAAREDIRVGMVDSQVKMELALVNSPELSLGLILPADFDQRAGDGQSIELQAYYPHWAAPDRLAQLEAFFEEQFHLAAPAMGPLTLAGQAVYPPVELSGRPVLLLMNLVAVILVIGIALVPLLMIEEKEAQTLKVLLVSPASLKQVIAGKALVGLFYSMLPALLVMLFYRYLFVHWGVALLAVLLTSALAVSVGLLLGVLADSPTSASMWGSLLLLLVIGSGLLKLLGGLNLPPAVLSVLDWLPGSAMLQLFSLSQAGDFPSSMLWMTSSSLLAAIAVVSVLLVWRIRCMET